MLPDSVHIGRQSRPLKGFSHFHNRGRNKRIFKTSGSELQICPIVQGNISAFSGDFIATGAAAPDFELVKTDLGTLSLSSLKGKRVILNIFPSLDTGVCAMSVRKFNQLAASLPDTVVLAISKDLPFAHARFCTVEGIENLVPLSDFRHSDFDENYGVLMADGPLQGLLARSVVVIDREGKVVYTELVPEITQEPDYDRAVEAAKRA